MALIQTSRNCCDGGGSGQTIAWERDLHAQTDPFTSGSLVITLTETPLDEDAIIVYSQDTPIQPGDYTFIAPNQIQIDFAGDPATDTDSGTWNFWIQYPYEVSTANQSLAWARDMEAETDPFTAGSLVFTLSQSPVDEDAIIVYSQSTPIQPGDYTFLSPNQIQIDFAGDPATDTDSGTWNFWIQYPYET